MQGILSTKRVLGAIVSAIDHYSFLLKHHHRRTAFIAHHLANTFGLGEQATSRLVLAASIHDIGALYVREREQLFQVDVLDPEPHEVLGAAMLEGFEPFEAIRRIVRHHHIRYSDLAEGRVPEEDVPTECFFLHLADRMDVLAETLGGDGGLQKQRRISERVDERFGTIFAPFLREVFHEVVGRETIWSRRTQPEFFELLILSVEEETFPASQDLLEGIAGIFSRIVDFKSKWTSRHSRTVARLAERLGVLAGLDKQTCSHLKVAGLLHDIGKVGIPGEMLDKAGPLDHEERADMQMHAVYSRLILSRIEGFESMARWASMHHEKHDHSGYPMQLGLGQFSIEVDILAYADILSALTEERPYRHGLKREALLQTLQKLAPEKLDSGIYGLIAAHIDELLRLVDCIAQDERCG